MLRVKFSTLRRGTRLLWLWLVCSCAITPTPHSDVFPTPQLTGLARERRDVRFKSQNVTLAGELALPLERQVAPLVFVIHHAGSVTRDAYGYLAELLLQAGYAVFRFDKRGTGQSGGTFGCCESADALAAYRAAVTQPEIARCNIFIVAQSIGTSHLAEQFGEYARLQTPRGVVLLSNLLRADKIGAIVVPLHIIISASEAEVEALGREAALAHRARYPDLQASYYVAAHSEHTLFDTQAGPLDWSDPTWVKRYHRGAMQSLIDWLNTRRHPSHDCSR